MGVYAAGQVVFLPFPFSDLSANKLRPVLLLAGVGHTDLIACQITSNPYSDAFAVPIDKDDFGIGGLRYRSYVRPGKLFTAHESLFLPASGVLKPPVLDRVREAVIAIIRG